MPTRFGHQASSGRGRRLRDLVLAVGLLSLSSGCSMFGMGEDRGYWLPLTVAVRYDRSVTEGALEYKDNCQQGAALPIGGALTNAMTRQLGLVFEHLELDGGKPADGAVDVNVGLKELDLFVPPRRSGTYKAKLTLGGTATYFDQSGNSLFSKSLRVETSGKVETDSRTCAVQGLEKLVAEGSLLLAEGFKKHLGTAPPIRRTAQGRQAGPRRALAAVPAASAPVPPAPSAGSTTPSPPPAGALIPLTFRAMLRDDNANQILEGGEQVTVKMEVTNTGDSPASGLVLSVQGTPALVQAFKAPVPVGDLQPGETKRLEIRGTLPAVSASEQAELVVAIDSAAGIPQISKKFIAALHPARLGDVEVLSVDVDRIPQRVRGYERRKAVAVVIGVGKFREAQTASVKFAAHDAETVAKYFQTVGGIPAEQVKVLTDERASKEDLAEVFDEWLPRHAKRDAIVFVYFSGRAVVDAAGAVSLVPHEGDPKAGSRLYSIRRLHSSLDRLPIQHAVLLLDVALEGPGAERRKDPRWNSAAEGEDGKMVHILSATGFQEAHRYDRGRHGLFTYYVLKALGGAADGDRDGQIAIAELFDYVREQVLKSAKSEYGNEQEPALAPELSPNAKVWDLPVGRVR